MSIPIRNTPALDVVWLPDRQVIFSTPPKRRFSVLFRAKRTSDSSSAPQNCLENIYLSLSGHLSSQEPVSNRAVRGATFAMYFSVRAYSHMFCMGIFARENLTCAISKTTWLNFIEQSSPESLKNGDNNRIAFFLNNLKIIVVISRFRKCYKNR